MPFEFGHAWIRVWRHCHSFGVSIHQTSTIDFPHRLRTILWWLNRFGCSFTFNHICVCVCCCSWSPLDYSIRLIWFIRVRLWCAIKQSVDRRRCCRCAAANPVWSRAFAVTARATGEYNNKKLIINIDMYTSSLSQHVRNFIRRHCLWNRMLFVRRVLQCHKHTRESHTHSTSSSRQNSFDWTQNTVNYLNGF